jgi:hypothetical protein
MIGLVIKIRTKSYTVTVTYQKTLKYEMEWNVMIRT